MEKQLEKDTFVRVTDSKDNEYFCPFDVARDFSEADFSFTDCVEKSVVRRYAGNIVVEGS